METTFKQSKVIGIDWTKAASIRALHFYNCDASQSFFDALKLPQLILKDCVVHEADFTGADCSKADFQGTDFEKTVFSQTNLTEANLNHTFNYSIDFRSNTLKKTKFSLPEATSLLGALDIILT